MRTLSCLAVALAAAAFLSACADQGRYDAAGYRLPAGSLAGTQGIFYIHEQAELQRIAQASGPGRFRA